MSEDIGNADNNNKGYADNKNKVYVGNLPYGTTETALGDHFRNNGVKVLKVTIIKERDTGRSKGFGFIECETDDDVNKAIELNSQNFTDETNNERPLKVMRAENRKPERSGGGGAGRGRGGDRPYNGGGNGGGERSFNSNKRGYGGGGGDDNKRPRTSKW